MKKRTKSIIYNTLIFTCIAGVIFIYTLPVLVSKLFIQNVSQDLIPVHTKVLPKPPMDWEQVQVEDFKFKLPMKQYKSLCISEEYGSFTVLFNDQSNRIVLHIGDLFIPKDLEKIYQQKNIQLGVLYEQQSTILSTTHADVKLGNSWSSNLTALINQILKLISIENVIKVNIIDLDHIKIICETSKIENKFSATASVYNAKEDICIYLFIGSFDTELALTNQLNKILGGLTLPSQKVPRIKIQTALKSLEKKYNRKLNKTEPIK